MKLKVKQKGFFYEIQQHSSSSSHSFTDRATGKIVFGESTNDRKAIMKKLVEQNSILWETRQ